MSGCVQRLIMNSGVNLHIIQQHRTGNTQRHVVHDLLGANVVIVFVLHEDGHEVVQLPGHRLSLRGQHTDELGVFVEAELFVCRQHGQALLPALIIGRSLRGDEGVHLQSLLRDEHPDVPLAVVAHLERSVRVPHYCCVIGQAEAVIGK